MIGRPSPECFFPMSNFGLDISLLASRLNTQSMTQVIYGAQHQIIGSLREGRRKLRPEDEPFEAWRPGIYMYMQSEFGPGTTLTWEWLNDAMYALRICALGKVPAQEMAAKLYTKMGMHAAPLGRLKIEKCLGTLQECSIRHRSLEYDRARKKQ